MAGTSWSLEILQVKMRAETIHVANNKAADQTAQMCRLIYNFVVPILLKKFF